MAMPYKATGNIVGAAHAQGTSTWDSSGAFRQAMSPSVAYNPPPWPSEQYVDPRLTVQGDMTTAAIPRYVPYAVMSPAYLALPQ